MFPSPSKVANDGSTLNNEARAQTLNGPSVLYDQQHFSLYLYLNALCSSITLWMNFQPDDKMQKIFCRSFFPLPHEICWWEAHWTLWNPASRLVLRGLGKSFKKPTSKLFKWHPGIVTAWEFVTRVQSLLTIFTFVKKCKLKILFSLFFWAVSIRKNYYQ